MKLYDLLKEKCDVDTYDKTYDRVVTCCFIDEKEIEDNYDKFCISLFKKVDVVDQKYDVVDWSGFIERNLNSIREFTDKYWDMKYNDHDVFVDQFIKEIHYYLAGLVFDDMYEILNQYLETWN